MEQYYRMNETKNFLMFDPSMQTTTTKLVNICKRKFHKIVLFGIKSKALIQSTKPSHMNEKSTAVLIEL